jgi:small subunit ribosomal protein S13
LVRDLSEQELKKIRDCIADKEFLVEGGLRASIAEAIKRIKDIGCYRGKRHKLGLPVRGQRTKNNCRTLKGVRKTVANKKIATR